MDDVKQFIKENLVIEIKWRHGDQVVQLRFVGETDPFTYEALPEIHYHD